MYDENRRHIEIDLGMGNPKVDSNKCVTCEMCLDECENDCIIISKKSGKAFIKQECCINCGACVDICPVNAIKRRK